MDMPVFMNSADHPSFSGILHKRVSSKTSVNVIGGKLNAVILQELSDHAPFMRFHLCTHGEDLATVCKQRAHV